MDGSCGILDFCLGFLVLLLFYFNFKSVDAKEMKLFLSLQFGLTCVPPRLLYIARLFSITFHMHLIQSLEVFLNSTSYRRTKKFLLCCDSSMAPRSLILGHPGGVTEYYSFCGIQLRRNIRS